jgi:hypothetical protein
MRLRLAGVVFTLHCRDERLLRAARSDFAVARDDEPATFRFRAIVRPLPPVARMGIAIGRARFTKWSSDVVALRYFRETWVVYRYRDRRALVVGPRHEEVLAVLSLVVQSALGEWLDTRGVHRVHASAIDVPSGPVLFLGTSGRGKSSHARAFLRAGVPVLADDTAFVTPDGALLPCTLPLKLRARPDDEVPTERRETARGEARYVVPIATPSASPRGPARQFFLLEPSLDGTSRLRASSRLVLFAALLRWMVVGHELPQMWELFLRPSLRDGLTKAGILLSRARTAFRLARRGKLERLEARPGSEIVVAERLGLSSIGALADGLSGRERPEGHSGFH